MAGNMQVTWLGDADPSQQVITEGGIRFVKGEAAKVPLDVMFNGRSWARKFQGNPMFSVEIDATEDGDDADEKAALKAQLRDAGEAVQGNPSLETLRTRVAALPAA